MEAYEEEWVNPKNYKGKGNMIFVVNPLYKLFKKNYSLSYRATTRECFSENRT